MGATQDSQVEVTREPRRFRLGDQVWSRLPLLKKWNEKGVVHPTEPVLYRIEGPDGKIHNQHFPSAYNPITYPTLP